MRKGLLYTACWIFLLISCAEDLGNYDYRELSSPVVTGIDEKIPVRKFERLQLTPQIEGEQFTEEDYQFEWKVIPQADAVTATVIGNERILDYEVVLAEGTYTLYFTITNRTSGLFWQDLRTGSHPNHFRGLDGVVLRQRSDTTGHDVHGHGRNLQGLIIQPGYAGIKRPTAYPATGRPRRNRIAFLLADG